jgi:PPK2 family polyphosphate:nucleotide phosphotransferase
MMTADPYRVDGSKPFRLDDVDPDDSGGFDGKRDVADLLKADRKRIGALQERLFAERRQGLLIVLQAMDTGGKDGTIKHVFQGINPSGCRVRSFKVPNEVERGHDFLWRYHQHTPRHGYMTIFNRSHYEDVLVVRVKDLVDETVWTARYDQINDFERTLAAAGTRILKFYLHISKDEQKARLQARLDNPDKHWKFSTGDLAERARWDAYQEAFNDAITNCATADAPWYVIPANRKWYRNHLVARIVADTMESMDPQFPEPESGLDRVVIPD